MGVPRLFPWLIKSFPNSVKHFQQGEYNMNVDYLYLDANGLLHAAAQEVENYGDNKRFVNKYASLSVEARRKKIYSAFFDNIVRVTQIVKPRKVLYIAIDGPAPRAKIVQQRERRFVAAKTRLEEEDESGRERFDSNQITPGTLFMLELTRYINYAIRREMNSYGSWRDIKVYFSPPTVPGEGEHKVVNYIRSLSSSEKDNSSHCLFGPDGDLIMLTLAVHINNMWLFREDQYNPGYLHILNMGLIRKELPRALGQVPGILSKTRNLDDVTNDFIVEGFFVGNDFLPKIQMFHLLEEGLEFMLDTYAYTSRQGRENFLTIDNKFSLPGFKVFVENISKYERKFLIDQAVTQDPRKQPPEPKYINNTLLSCITQKPGRGWVLDMVTYRKKYYEKIGINGDVNSPEFKVSLKKMCRDYLRTFIWVFEYYINGLPSWDWAYEHHYAPLMIDLNDYIQNLDIRDFSDISSFQIHSPFLPFEQLLSVLPPPSADLLPKPYQRLMKDENSPLVKLGYYPKTFDIDYEGKLKEFQGVALLPFVDNSLIHKNYLKMTKCCVRNPENYVRNSKGKDAVFWYDKNYKAKFKSDMGNIDSLKVRKRFL